MSRRRTRRTESLGARGEALAADWLRRRGHRIAARNVRTAHGEIDLLVRRGRTWIAVEVKARGDHPAPERTVDGERLLRLERALLALAAHLRPLPRALRIDVVAIRWRGAAAPELRHFAALRAWTRDDGGAPSSTGRWRRCDEPVYCRGANGGGWRRWLPWFRRLFPVVPIARPRRPAGPASAHEMPTLTEQMIPRRKLLLMGSESVLITGILFFGGCLPPLASRSLAMLPWLPDVVRGMLTSFTIAVICQTSLSYNDLYDWRTAQNRAELPNRLLHACGYSLVMLAVLVVCWPGLFYFPSFDIGGQTWKLILLVGVSFMAIWGFRHAFHWFFYKWRFGERVLVLGASTEAQELAQMIAQNPLAGYELMGLVQETDEPLVPWAPGTPVHERIVGALKDLRSLCDREGIARVVVSLRERRGRVPIEQLLDCRMAGITVEERETMYERLTGKLAVESMRPSYLIFGSGFARDPVTLALKRVLDIVASFTGLVVSLPLSLAAALLVKATSRGPVFFLQDRVGQDGQPFKLVKFRTMRHDAEKESGPVWAQKNDDRITFVGRFLRLTRIDEVPQFWNILAGQMSFVGPRPERPHFVAQLTAALPFYPLRHTIKPGLTGWAQVCHPYGASVEDATEKLRYDLYYIKNVSLVFDVNIILRTIGVILLGKGAR
jgi:sugar transferase (PEP-CTERM system associated)